MQTTATHAKLGNPGLQLRTNIQRPVAVAALPLQPVDGNTVLTDPLRNPMFIAATTVASVPSAGAGAGGGPAEQVPVLVQELVLLQVYINQDL